VIEDTVTAVNLRYVVRIDDDDLGEFSSCEGLGCEVVIETREEGGNNGMVWQLPTRLKYPNIKLTRPLGPDSHKVAALFGRMASGYSRDTSGTVQAMTTNGTVVAEWGLIGIIPVRWTGPSLNADSQKVVTETVELAHHGFTASKGSAAASPAGA
jgi:phage tail-like protein